MNKVVKSLILTLALSTALPTLAETRYVTDQLKITLRSGESSNHRIVRMLSSGMAVQVLSNNAESGYSRVRAGDSEGYVLTRQLLNEPSARDQVAALKAKVAALSSAPSKLQQDLNELSSKNQALQAANTRLETEKLTLEQDFAALQRTASSAVQIADERNTLRKQVSDLARQSADLQLRTNELENSNLQKWFLIGAGVLFGGMVLGLILPNLKLRRRRSNWDSL